MSSLELTALPPLPPTAFLEIFSGLPELEKSTSAAHIKRELPLETLQQQWPGSDDDAVVTKKHRVLVAETPQTHKSVINSISPCGFKKQAVIDEAETKRARRSAIEKKSRQRRQTVLRRMREEVRQLENQYAEMAGKTQGPPWPHRSEKQRGNSPTINQLQQKFSDLSLVAHALEKDHEELQTLLQQHTDFQQTVQSLSNELVGKKHHVWNCGVPPSLSFSAMFNALSVAECYALVRKSYKEIQRFNDAKHFESTGANFMGWTDKRTCDSRTGALLYGFTKKFWLETPEELLIKTWDIMLDGLKFRNMSFDSSVTSRYEVLQELNDDLRIIRRDYRIPLVDMTFVTIQIMFRLQTPTGYTLCIRTIPAPEIQSVQDPQEHFYDFFHWTHFNRLYDDDGKPAGCEIMSGGSIAKQNHLKPSYWLFELVCSLLRWETACIAPLFLKNL